MHSRLIRFLVGLAAVILVLGIGFAIALATIPTFGSTPEELALALPGDERISDPTVSWKHAITINAVPEQVWPWIIQMGDDRAGFYSYTFIERLIDPTPGLYVNAEQVHPEWQSPPVGNRIIADIVKVVAYEPNRYLFVSADPNADFVWTWVWQIAPAAGGRTRMVIHMGIQVPPEANSPLLTGFMNLGAFIMERNLMTGLKLRAEGGSEPAWIETLEIVLWAATLLVGIGAVVLYMRKPRWQFPLAVGLAAVTALLVLTFLQPAIWLRVVMLLALIGGLAAARRA